MRAKKPRGKKWKGMQRQFAKAIIRNNYFMKLRWSKMAKYSQSNKPLPVYNIIDGEVTAINFSNDPIEDCGLRFKIK